MVPVIEVKNVRMVFNLMEERVDTLKEYVMRLIKGQLFYNEFVSLDDVSFTIDKMCIRDRILVIPAIIQEIISPQKMRIIVN